MKGKDKCEFLKGIRKRMADANGIPYEPRECNYEGECAGTCPFCEREAAEILSKLKENDSAIIKTDTQSVMTFEEVVRMFEDYKGPTGHIVCRDIDVISRNKEEVYPSSLVNSIVDKTDMSKEPVDPFRGSNNPLVTEKELREIKHIHNREREPLMGDIDYDEWSKKLQEELIREEMERNKELGGRILEEVYDEEITERKRKEKSFINKMLNRIKNAIVSPLEGEIDE